MELPLVLKFKKELTKPATKKIFANVRNDVSEQNAYDVADAIKAVLEASTRNTSLTVSSDLVKA